MKKDILYALALGAISAGLLYEIRLLIESVITAPFIIAAICTAALGAGFIHYARKDVLLAIRFFIIAFAMFLIVFLPLVL
jgi:hypothetical protein